MLVIAGSIFLAALVFVLLTLVARLLSERRNSAVWHQLMQQYERDDVAVDREHVSPERTGVAALTDRELLAAYDAHAATFGNPLVSSEIVREYHRRHRVLPMLPTAAAQPIHWLQRLRPTRPSGASS